MKSNYKTILQASCIALWAIVALQSPAYGTTRITGTVTAKKADIIKLEFEPDNSVGPNIGDHVDFNTQVSGIDVKAGEGEITITGYDFVWAKTIKGRPNLKMSGTILATGKPMGLIPVLEEAYQNLKQGEDEDSLRLLKKYAGQGQIDAQFYLGRVYWGGHGVKESDPKALQLFQLAADQGHIGSQANIGWSYVFGYGVAKDEARAMTIFRQLADRNIAEGQGALGYGYLFGKGVKQDCKQALDYIQLAVKAEDPNSINSYGLMLVQEKCVDKDVAKGLKYIRRAADAGHEKSMYVLGYFHENGKYLEKDIDKAITWYKKSRNGQSREALERLQVDN